ncbi:GNAT family N-acetyltransferase [Cytobacillus firmus]|uniref:GNAT family N-acetyltransferase n=1 Tax=Cytobacillus firmus TaxID=1399 RepID=UPI001C98C2FB|nr:GNAT family N-acetyltransferase [Cytobacillus firmus]MBY6051938.1 GNAT family N-acetyltransferase [Cytobacillus firmus]USK39869.1 GNAT family N-acetyltransferase [Cytobacillus firmus]
MGKIIEAKIGDAVKILSIQKLAYRSEAELYGDFNIEPLKQTVSDVEKAFEDYLILKYIEDGELVGSVRAYQKDETCYIGKLMVHPDFQNKGIGKALMNEIERQFNVERFELFTGSKSEKNISFYEKLGYAGYKTEKLEREETIFIFMEKLAKAGTTAS